MGTGAANYEQSYLVYGVPEPPVGMPHVSDVGKEVYSWGDAHGEWGPKSYTDGSGYASSVPELRRCGSSVVQLDPGTWLPIRAKYGPLPYIVQTVGRAERYSVKLGLDANPNHEEFVSDLLSLVKEGLSWRPELACGRAKHARAWRDIFGATAARSARGPPIFRWTPAHRELDSLIGEDACELQDFIGNSWADYFAKLGAMSHA